MVIYWINLVGRLSSIGKGDGRVIELAGKPLARLGNNTALLLAYDVVIGTI